MAGGNDASAARDRFLNLLRAGGSDYPMELLRTAGIDLSQPDTVRAVVDQLDGLVTRLERELESTLKG
jgi:oligoendopeptidase F